jgi:hypothetical protein
MTTMSWINLFLGVINAFFAYDSFKRGHNKSGWISLVVSAFCITTAVL